MQTATALSLVGFSILFVYDGIGALFLVRDYGVVSSCRASNSSAHAVWPTSLWTYVLFSLIFTSVFGAALALLPVKRTLDAARKHIKGGRSRMANDAFSLKYGLLATLPDWLFLWVGSVLILASLGMFILAFWGFFELFMARPWCDGQKTAFEELDLWYFGRVTFVLQIIIGTILLLWGILYWGAPMFLEATMITPPPSPPQAQSYGDGHWSSSP